MSATYPIIGTDDLLGHAKWMEAICRAAGAPMTALEATIMWETQRHEHKGPREIGAILLKRDE